MRRLAFTALGALAVGLLGVPTAQATVMIPLSVEDLSARSAAVVRGRVLAKQSAWDDEHRKIHTYTEIEILATVHATNAVPKTIVVRTMGGEVGDIGMRVSGTPKFEEGEEVFVFLRTDPRDARQFQVVGMAQGKYRVERDSGAAVAVPSEEGLAFVRPDASGVLKVSDDGPVTSRVPLATLEARVKKAMATSPSAPKLPSQPTAPNPPVAPAQ